MGQNCIISVNHYKNKTNETRNLIISLYTDKACLQNNYSTIICELNISSP